ncbi:MAG: hypothetical protein JW844_03245 [Candidatus Omnitrophica bacterium]|nr:hypothetical protein [Candidatus Omnitrophota bacterium]
MEVVIVMILVSILSVYAIIKLQDLIMSARAAMVKSSLGVMRQGVWDFYAAQAANGSARFPTLEEFSEEGGGSHITMDGLLPVNPFDYDGNAQNVVLATTEPQGTVIGSSGGWAYRPQASGPGKADAGQVWANTSTGEIEENRF